VSERRQGAAIASFWIAPRSRHARAGSETKLLNAFTDSLEISSKLRCPSEVWIPFFGTERLFCGARNICVSISDRRRQMCTGRAEDLRSEERNPDLGRHAELLDEISRASVTGIEKHRFGTPARAVEILGAIQN